MVPRHDLQHLARFAAFGTLIAASACGSPASFPGRSEVGAEQARWCESMAAITGYGDAWEPRDDCLAASPAASPAYLRQMTHCLAKGPFSHFVELDPPVRIAALSRGSEVHRQVLGDCHDEVTANLRAEQQQTEAMLSALCGRSGDCASSAGSCRAERSMVEDARLLAATYNEGARLEIATCVATCAADDAVGRDECLRTAKDRLLWFPD